MATRNVQIIVLPVSVDLSGHQSRLIAYRPGGKWLATSYSTTDAPGDKAVKLFREQGPPAPLSVRAGAEEFGGRPEAVTFVETEDGRIQLVYTLLVPVTTALVAQGTFAALDEPDVKDWVVLTPDLPDEEEDSGTSWTRVVDAAVEQLDPVARVVLEHWRQQVEETTAGMEFLPRYFTIGQLRSVYEAIWMTNPDPGNFHRWIRTTNDDVCSPVGDDVVERARDDMVLRVYEDSGLSDPPDLTALADAVGGLVGISPLAVRRLAPVVPALAAVGAAAGGAIAYQVGRSRGRPAQWFERSEARRTVLKELYAPRPRWQAAGIGAHPSGH